MQVVEAGKESYALMEPLLTEEGVLFTVAIEWTPHQCLITGEALEQLARDHGFSMDPMNTYRAFEARINSVARRLLFRGEAQSPLILEAERFH